MQKNWEKNESVYESNIYYVNVMFVTSVRTHPFGLTPKFEGICQ